MSASQKPNVLGDFTLADVAYRVTTSAGPHTVGVYEVATGLMVCTVRNPSGRAEPAWGHQWSGAAEAWQHALLGLVAAACERRFAPARYTRTEGGGQR